MSRPQSYILCTSPRSGSTLLCTLLRESGVAGYPESWFHRPSLVGWAKDLEIPLPKGSEPAKIATLIAAAKDKGLANGALFALRLQRQSAPFFLQMLARLHPDLRHDRDRLRACFGETRFLYLNRSDKIAQAVSYMRAQQTGLWHRAADGSELERLASHREPYYDHAFLAQWVKTFTQYDARWRTWFARERITPYALSYDTLSNDPTGCLRAVLAALSLTPPKRQDISPGVQRLSDTLNAEWIERFKRENRATGTKPPGKPNH